MNLMMSIIVNQSEVEEDNIKIIDDDFMEFNIPWVVEEIIE